VSILLSSKCSLSLVLPERYRSTSRSCGW